MRSETRSWGAVSCARPSDCCPRLPSWTTQRYVARRKAKQIAAAKFKKGGGDGGAGSKRENGNKQGAIFASKLGVKEFQKPTQ